MPNLTPFEGQEVIQSTADIKGRGLGGGLNGVLEFGPVEWHGGERIRVVAEFEIEMVGFPPIPDTPFRSRRHTLKLVDGRMAVAGGKLDTDVVRFLNTRQEWYSEQLKLRRAAEQTDELDDDEGEPEGYRGAQQVASMFSEADNGDDDEEEDYDGEGLSEEDQQFEASGQRS
jgi:hypothetical protein